MTNFVLLQVGGPIEMRYKEWTERGPVLEQLVYCIRSFREAALSVDPKFDHIDISEKQKVHNVWLILEFPTTLALSVTEACLEAVQFYLVPL
jgi:hypothetical protein